MSEVLFGVLLLGVVAGVWAAFTAFDRVALVGSLTSIGLITRASVAPGSTIYSDAFLSYHGLAAEYVHEVIDHAEGYVRDRVHTNGLENFWSLFKRMIYGTHHSVDPEHLDRYLDEATYRFNSRDKADSSRFVATTASVIGKRITYRELIGKEVYGQ